MFSSRLYQQSVFYSVSFIVYYWLFMMSQPSIIAVMPAVYYPKLLIVSVFFPLLLVTVAYLLIESIFPKKWRSYVFGLVPTGILTYLIYIFLDKLSYSKFGKNSLNLSYGFKIPFLLALLSLFILVYYKHLKTININSKKFFKLLTKYFVLSVYFLSICIFSYYLFFQKKYELNVVKTKNFNPVNVLIVSIDGAEDDLMSVYGYKKDTTPFLKSIKNEFLVGDNFYTNNCCTFGSLASLYTGKLPFETKVVYPGSHLIGNNRYEHLPGILKNIGYNTIQLTTPLYAESTYMGILDGFIESNYRKSNYFSYFKTFFYSSFFYERVIFFQQIWDTDFLSRLFFVMKNRQYINPYKEVNSYTAKNISLNTDPFFDDNKTIYISNLLKKINKNNPFFIHLHFMATHVTEPKVYESGMIKSDENIKTLYLSLKGSGLINNTIFIVTSDHNLGWKTLKPIPLLIRFPHLAHAGEHIKKNIQIIDLAPTILDYIGIKKPNFMSGESFLNKDDIIENRFIYSVEAINILNGFILPDKGTFGVSQVKVQMCNNYLLVDVDEKGKVIKTKSFVGYANTQPCLGRYGAFKYDHHQFFSEL